MTQLISVLVEDSQLASGLSVKEAAAARERAVAAVQEAAPGPWMPPSLPDDPPGSIGALLLDGVLARDVNIAGIGCTDLLGRGDLLYPADPAEGQASIPMEVAFEALEPLRVAILDGRFADAIAPWPGISAQLFARAARVTHSLGVHFAITCFVGLELRLFLLLWHLADRFGTVEPYGVVVPLRLTHDNLARIVRARRPSVTSALTQLADRGLVVRQNGGWVLRGDPLREWKQLRDQEGDADGVDARGREPGLIGDEATPQPKR